MTKDQLRKKLLARLKQQKEDERRRRSEAIRRKVTRLTAFRQAAMVCCYVALPYEVQTWKMIEHMLARGKRVAVPLMQPRQKRLICSEVRDPATELAPGTLGVLEPVPSARRPVALEALDLVFVPGLAFDRRGHRLGHGQGYFDRFLARLPETTPTLGLAFRFQLFDRLPTSTHDLAVRQVLTA
jgi:5-formyltetrahydrofolate cyclo-ligase